MRFTHIFAGASVVTIAGVALGAPLPQIGPPWIEPGDVPLPDWAHSVAPKKPELEVFAAPGRMDLRRGTGIPEARFPFYAAKRAAGCGGRWLQIGATSWVCSDAVDFTPDPPWRASDSDRWMKEGAQPTGLPFRYFFVGSEGAPGFGDLASTEFGAPDREFERGFSVAIVEERAHAGSRWGKTAHNLWIAMSSLVAARPSAFHGEDILEGQSLDLAWVLPQTAQVREAPSAGAKGKSTRTRFQVVRVLEEKNGFVRIADDPAWMSARDLARPHLTTPPGSMTPGERWIDVELATQTLVAYEGVRPVFATLVSTGRGAQGTETATPKGEHRIWVKLHTTNMDNLERDDVENHYAIEDVPYVQFFDKGVALHAAFWHASYGTVKSHGCVNLSPVDAKRLFAWTFPRLPPGFSASLPTTVEKGTLVRVH